MGKRLLDGPGDAAQPACGGRRTRPGHAGGDRTGGGQGQRASLRSGLGARVVAECGKRGLIIRQRGASAGPPASGDSLCLAPPLMTPEATLDRIVQIVGESIAAAM